MLDFSLFQVACCKYAGIIVCLILMELLYFRIADRYNITDKPNSRSSHSQITIRGGGVLFPLGMLLYFLFFGGHYPWFLLGLGLVSMVSFIDDVKPLPNKVRLVVQFVAMLLMCYQWQLFNATDWWMVVVALIFCTGIINAFNFMDGINGITGGYSLVVLLLLWLVNSSVAFIDSSYLVVAMMSVLVFCFFNFRSHARCFAGDVGSIAIAFIVLFPLGALIIKSGNVGYILFLAIYGVDVILTILHRLLLRENIFVAHRKHAFQLLANELGWPHVAVSLLYMLLQFGVGLGYLYCGAHALLYAILVLSLLVLLYLGFMKRNYYRHEAYLKSKLN